jgi:hypothetical protein
MITNQKWSITKNISFYIKIRTFQECINTHLLILNNMNKRMRISVDTFFLNMHLNQFRFINYKKEKIHISHQKWGITKICKFI